jgi:hypothetical protein
MRSTSHADSPRATRRALLVLASVSLLGACADGPTSSADAMTETLLAEAFSATPAGYASTENSFAGAENEDWRPRRQRNGGRGGPFGAAFGVGPMGGGIGADFTNGGSVRDGLGRGPFGGALRDSDCVFNETAQRAECTSTRERNGLTVDRWVIWKDQAGTVQRRPDSTTFSMQTHAEVSGTVVRRDSSTRTVRHVSDRLVTGLQKGSTERRVEGTSAGTERVEGIGSAGAFVADRVLGDTVRGVVIPVRESGRSYPTAGTVIRSMRATVTVTGQAPEVSTWREVITYDGSATATLTITRNGETKTCSLPLPMGRPTCE